MAWVCTTCGFANEDSYRHCSMCGGPRSAVPAVKTPAQMRIRGLGLMAAGVATMFLAGLVTLLTYALAASSPGGGIYLVVFGPVLLGAFMVIRGARVVVGHAPRLRPPV